ncbi:MAG: ABC transporter ATP-binding protein [Candidatus Ornithomonoglobus sp.]
MIKTLSKSLRQHKKGSLLTVLLSALEVAFEIFIPLCMSRLIDFGIEKGNMAQVWRYGAALVIFAMIQLTAGIISARTAARASAGFAANLRQDMYDNVQTFSFSNIDRFSASSIVTRLTTDITNIQNAYQMLIRMAVRGPVMMIFALIVSFNINREISMVFLAVIPLLAVFLMMIIRRVNPIFNGVFRAYDRLNNVVQENVRGIRVVKSFNRSDSEINKFEGISENIFRGFAKGERLLALNTPLMQFFMYACMLLISWLGAKAIVACGNDPALGLTTGGLTALISYATQILVSLMMLSMVFAMIVIAVSSAARISEILSEKTDISNPDSPVTEVKNGDVSFENVSFAYSFKADKWVLDKVNIDIRSGEIIGILGGTGSSKSSLVQLIPRLYDATEGRVTVGGVDVRKYDLDALRGSVAMVLQKNELFSGTVKENLRWGNENATDEEIRHACRLACADEFISTLPDGYDTHIEQGGSNVSGGQKQRLCIARALLKKPKVLILDDSTSAVDTKTDASIQRSFAEYIPETTKIIIAQRVSSVMLADRIIVLDGGKVNAIGNHEELLKSCGIYREIFLSQQKGAENNE